jgi:predicted transcriptional regulator
MKKAKKRKTGTEKQLAPRFKSEEEEAEHWDTHSPLDLGAEPRAEKVGVRGAKDRPVTIRLDSETRRKLEELAAKRGVGPSTLARSILTSAIEHKGSFPANLEDMIEDLLEQNESIKDQAERLTKDISIGAPDNPAYLIYNSQMNELGKLGLQVMSILLAMYDVQVITQEHTKYKAVKSLVQSGT